MTLCQGYRVMDRWRAEHALAREIRSRMGLCRKLSLEAICGMVSPSDSQYNDSSRQILYIDIPFFRRQILFIDIPIFFYCFRH